MHSYFSDPSDTFSLMLLASFVVLCAFVFCGCVARDRSAKKLTRQALDGCVRDTETLLRLIALPCVVLSEVSKCTALTRELTALEILAAVVIAALEPCLGAVMCKTLAEYSKVTPATTAEAASPTTPESASPASSPLHPLAVLAKFGAFAVSSTPIAMPLLFVTTLSVLQEREELNLARETQLSTTVVITQQRIFDFQLARGVVLVMIVARMIIKRLLLRFVVVGDDATSVPEESAFETAQKFTGDSLVALLCLVTALVFSAFEVVSSSSSSSSQTGKTGVLPFIVGVASSLADIVVALTAVLEGLAFVSPFWPDENTEQSGEMSARIQEFSAGLLLAVFRIMLTFLCVVAFVPRSQPALIFALVLFGCSAGVGVAYPSTKDLVCKSCGSGGDVEQQARVALGCAIVGLIVIPLLVHGLI